MSNFMAIGGVSATLQRLLKDRMELPPNETVQVTVSSPRSEQQNGQDVEQPRVNLFLYRVTENGALKNQDIIGQGHPAAYGNPPLSLDLHYLLTAYGTKNELETFVNESLAHQMLGSAMRVLHDSPIITDAMETASNQPMLDESIRHQYEKVKITLDPLSLEDFSKIWTALSLPFRLSAAYTVNVVQIESRRQRRTSLPVKTRRLSVALLRRPQIAALYRTPDPGETIGDLRARILDLMTIEGSNFASPLTRVKLGTVDPVMVMPNSVSNGQIELQVPNNLRLQPGAQVAEVVTQRPSEAVQGGLSDKGDLTLGQSIQNSNQTVFMLVPRITSATSGNGLLTVEGTRLYHEDLKSFVLIGDVAIEVRPPPVGQNPPPWADPTPTSIQVPLAPLTNAVPPLPPDSYRVRVRVNGAESMEENFTFQVT